MKNATARFRTWKMTKWLYLFGDEEIGQWKGLRKKRWELGILYLLWEILYLKNLFRQPDSKIEFTELSRIEYRTETMKALNLRRVVWMLGPWYLHTYQWVRENTLRKWLRGRLFSWLMLIDYQRIPLVIVFCLKECWYERHPFIWLHKWNRSFSSRWLIILHYFIRELLSIKAIVMGGFIRQTLLKNTMELYS